MTEARIAHVLRKTPFVPHPALKNPHAQTLAASLLPRRTRLLDQTVEHRVFEGAPGARLLGYCNWQPDRESKPVIVMLHGLQGSADSPYMLGAAEKALAAGFSVIRLNLRNCGGTDHLTPLIYNAGLTEDPNRIIAELIERDRLREVYLAGFSLGGNMVLKLAGEYGQSPPRELRGLVAVSPSIDLASCADAIELRSNLFYHLNFVWSLRSTLRRKAQMYPDRYDASQLSGVWTIRQFDDRYTAPISGFRDSADYYARASALPLIAGITVPTLIVHAKDDPFIPFEPFTRDEVVFNSNVALVAPDYGGHLGFIAEKPVAGDRFWAEAMITEFVKLVSG